LVNVVAPRLTSAEVVEHLDSILRDYIFTSKLPVKNDDKICSGT
jgi:hypothetical protein